MGRVIFESSDIQVKFIKQVRDYCGFNTRQLAFICKVNPRTFRDWQIGKYSISDLAYKALNAYYPYRQQLKTQVVDDYWYTLKGARNGALRKMELYGPPGTPEGRRKGGLMSQQKRKEDPEKYKLLGCTLRKTFKIKELSVNFAEAAGIILGDGGITDSQLRISLSSIVDRPYAVFVETLFMEVFGEKPQLSERTSCNNLVLTLSGCGLVEELGRWDFVRGNKVRNQIDFPNWIWSNLEYQKACVRGLMDTDGGCYFHTHTTNGLTYKNFGMCFTNKSLPIVRSVEKVLKSLGLKFSIVNEGTQIYIYSFKEIQKYFNIIGSHNLKNNQKFEYYLNQKTHRINYGVGCRSGLTGDPGKIV